MSKSISGKAPSSIGIPISQRVYEQIRERIISMTWQPGARVSEKDVATELGVSKTPVREAFIRLSEEGLMDIRPQSGSYVSKISFERVYESLMLRRALEMAVAAEAASQRGAIDLIKLQDLIDLQTQAAAQGDGPWFLKLDREFHSALIEIAKMPSASRIIRALLGTVDRVQTIRMSKGKNRHQEVIAAHQDILDAISLRDGPAAAAAMDAHLNCIDLFAQIIRSPEVRDLVVSHAS
ncbi:GntR family transcriptional regulator [Pelagimonas varians]|uniref:Putative HTH-type transcriptional regulator YdfH n=1 Tax=Pelagimonas varians TaxID=696760 RepID=A0A238KN64_9RHOB|nr:GntR family transcriptional regulator [Pelagimonas varians]PYG28924.1 GntR family transcriptional regulator [Pelagimonas varians]SMX44101.1 putative HTH-type transcriptional regulator YdfH [Pelagimonas varians]